MVSLISRFGAENGRPFSSMQAQPKVMTNLKMVANHSDENRLQLVAPQFQKGVSFLS